jgi:hypothetical protein
MDRIAFVIPVHPPSFHHMYRFLNRYPGPSRIYLVFSSTEDRDSFGHHPCVVPIVIPQGLTYDSASQGGIVDYKKFYALSQLTNAPHDYFIVCDSEIHLVTHNFTPENVLFKIESMFANKKIYYGYLDGEGHGDIGRILEEFSESECNTLKRLTSHCRAHFWWSDLPVYRRDHLEHFFTVCPIPARIKTRPDYLIYQCYLALHHGFTFVNATHLVGLRSSLEGFATQDEDKIHIMTRVGYGHSWVTSTQYKINYRLLDILGTFLVYHLDRWTMPDYWDPNRKDYAATDWWNMPTK